MKTDDKSKTNLPQLRITTGSILGRDAAFLPLIFFCYRTIPRARRPLPMTSHLLRFPVLGDRHIRFTKSSVLDQLYLPQNHRPSLKLRRYVTTATSPSTGHRRTERGTLRGEGRGKESYDGCHDLLLKYLIAHFFTFSGVLTGSYHMYIIVNTK